jgi:hypothetical protein
MPRSELSDTYDRLMGIVGQILGLNEEERGFVLDRVAPMPEAEQSKKPKRKPPKGGSKSGSKSPRASNLGATIKGNLDQRRVAGSNGGDDEDGPRCTYFLGDDAPCDATEHSPVHRRDGGYLKWHEFQPASPLAHGAEGE